jgi:hypothetical protein
MDLDDTKLNTDAVKDRLSTYQNLTYHYGNSKTKIQAVNADIPDNGWDIVVIVSDDMIPVVKDFDNIIRANFCKYFPDLDGCTWFFDGYVKSICTLSIIGKKYYSKFNYIYHPAYQSLFCDNEFTEVAMLDKKMVYIDDCIIKHEHYCWTKETPLDELYKKNEALYSVDELVYKQRKLKNFK